MEALVEFLISLGFGYVIISMAVAMVKDLRKSKPTDYERGYTDGYTDHALRRDKDPHRRDPPKRLYGPGPW